MGGHLGWTGDPQLNLANKTALGRVGEGDRTLTRKVEAYRSISWDCWDENRQAQPRLELELMKGMRGNKGISTATLAADLCIALTGDIVMKDTEETKGFSTSPVSVCSQASQVSASQLQHGPQCSWDEEKPIFAAHGLSVSQHPMVTSPDKGTSSAQIVLGDSLVWWKGNSFYPPKKQGKFVPCLRE